MMDEEKTEESSKESDEAINLNMNFDFLKNKKFQIVVVIFVFALIAVLAFSMRVSNLHLLVDHTTGNYTLSDPDAMYWLRLEGHLLATGNLNGIDTMRNPGLNVPYNHEFLVYTIVGVYKFLHNFNPGLTYQLVDTVYPAYAFLISLAVFFFLIYFLTKSKTASLIGSFLLAYSPAFLFRTITGVSGHEALGTMFLFATFLVFLLSLKRFGKNWKETTLWGVLTGFFITITYVSWNGTANFMFLILPIALFLFYVYNLRKGIERKEKFLLFYVLMIFVSLVTTYFFHSAPHYISHFFFIPTGVLIPGFFLFALIDTAFDYFKIKSFRKVKESRYRLLITGILTVITGIIFLAIFKGEGFNVIGGVYDKLIHPLSQARVALTVAYYAQPYLTDFQSQVMLPLFWLFIVGSSFLLFEMSKGVKSLKKRLYLTVGSIISLFAILFSRYSSTSTFNGVNFISQFVYFLGFLGLAAYLIFIYKDSKEKIDTSLIFLFSWMIIMLVTIRAAQRTIFLVVPYMVVIASYLIIKSWNHFKGSKKETQKYIYGIIFILAILLAFAFIFGNPFKSTPGGYYLSNAQAQSTGPLMNTYWQNAMAWVRNNTAPDSVFLSWWDYGYQIQTAGHRTTVLDGGNFNAYWDYLMGRYVLTTPNPNTAYSFMKTHNVSYFLMDPSDIGKYSAYSSIGNAANTSDRASYLPTLVSNPSQSQETSNGTTRIYQGGFYLDSDLIINVSGQPFLLPQGSAALGAILIQYTNTSASQPQGVYVYNNQQYEEPIRYLYVNGNLIDFHKGVNATVYVYPNVLNQRFDSTGAAMYLSSKTQDSLVAQIDLMNDPHGWYKNLKLVEQAGPYPFNFYYNRFQAPVRIWYVNRSAMTNILTRPEFMATSGVYGADDNLTFTTNAQVNSNTPMIPVNMSSINSSL